MNEKIQLPSHPVKCFILIVSLLAPSASKALTYDLPLHGNIIGEPTQVQLEAGDTLFSIGRQFNIGAYEMKEANPNVSIDHPQAGTMVIIPSQFILPSGPRTGIVINLAEMRLYSYNTATRQVSTYPIGIGQDGWLTPMGDTQIVRKREHPTWVVPDSILENHERHGQPIDRVWPPGPDNPLGTHAMNLGFKNIVIHGSPYPHGVGLRSSHGCIRMLNSDVEELYAQVNVGTKVRIIHEPIKIGIMANQLFLESHVPLSEASYQEQIPLKTKIDLAVQAAGYGSYSVEWEQIFSQQNKANGLPEWIGLLE